MSWLLAPQNDYRAAKLGDPTSVSVTVVIPVYNRAELLERTLAGLVAQSQPAKVIVADDGSEEDISAVVKRFNNTLDVTLVQQSHDGYGAGQARNLGAANSSSDILIFIDGDCIPDPHLVEHHARHHAKHSNMVVIGSRRHILSASLSLANISSGEVDYDADSLAPGKMPADFRDKLGRRTTDNTVGTEAFRFLVSSNFSVKKDMFDAVGGFSEDFKRWGGEDTELGWRLAEHGLLFISDTEATIFHQTDLEGPDGWREQQVKLNRGLIATKIPHRFFRPPNSLPGIAEVPKISVLLSPPPSSNLPAVVDSMLRHTTTDVEILVHADPNKHEPYAGAVSSDPRVRLIPGELTDLMSAARGELVVRAHGAAVLDRRCLARIAKVFDDQPTTSSTTVSVRVAAKGGWVEYIQPNDVDAIQHSWGEALPMVFGIRRRDWNKCAQVPMSPLEAWQTIHSWNRPHHMSIPLFSLPSTSPAPRNEFPHAIKSPSQRLASDLRKGGIRSILPSLAVYRRSFRAAPEPAISPPESLPKHPVMSPISARYVGWVGHDNLGDEALLEAISIAMPWAKLSLTGHPTNLLLLGGGTLINRPGYLKILNDHNSPRLERAVFGSGISNPEFWGKDTDRAAWADYLKSCSYVGLRGPSSIQTLQSWGYDGMAEVIGDPALLFERPSNASVIPGSILLSPAWTRDNLWGKSDSTVFTHMTRWVEGWISEGRQVTLLACSPDDDRPLLQIIQQLGSSSLRYVPGYLDTREAISAIANVELVVGERLHACVLAAAVGTPFVGLEYRPKLRDFAASIGVESLMMRTDELDADRLRELITLARDEETVATIAREVTAHRIRLERGAEQIRKAVEK